MQLESSLLYTKQLIHISAMPTAPHFARPLPTAISALRCITGSARLLPRIPRRTGSRLYHKYGHGDGEQGEDVSRLRHAPHWGFLIYRCDYRCDDAWNAFIEGWSSRVKSYLDEQYGDADLASKMLFTVKDDRSSLEKASIQQVQKLFATWIRSDEAHAEREAADYGRISYSRYEYCVHVDASALDVCLEWFARTSEDSDAWPMSVTYPEFEKTPYVNIVKVDRRLYLAPDLTELAQEIDSEDEDIEEDGDDKGPMFVKMELRYVQPAVYTRMCTFFLNYEGFVRRC
jgi:hypothetical protein